MSSKAQLVGYSSIAIVDETNQNLDSANTEESWVQANVILPAKLADASEVIEEGENQKGVSEGEITPVYHDTWCAVLFLIHIAAFLYIGVTYGSVPAMDSGSDKSPNMEDFDTTYSFLKILIPGGIAISFFLTYFITALLLPRHSKLLVEASLYTSLFMWTATALMIFFAFPNIWTILIGVGIVILNLWYIATVRIFIPFAAANLKLAAQAVSSNAGVYFLSFIMGFVGFSWFAFWSYTANGVGLFEEDDTTSSSSQNKTDDYYYDPMNNAALGAKGFGLLLSLYWTLNVLGNITQTTTAGVTGTWCFDKNSASSCCSSAVTQSFMRSCTYSFGSICFGSLLNALVTTLRVMAQWARDSARNDSDGGAALIYCILACILSCIEDIIEYFNQWAYIFVGIYGTSYLESGKRVLELFNARGITAIISNGLASYVLTNVVLSSSLLCGLFGYLLGGFDTVSFWTCFIIGLIISATMMNIVQGAVKAVIVCFADHPHRLYENHPEGTAELSMGISQGFDHVAVPVFNNTVV